MACQTICTPVTKMQPNVNAQNVQEVDTICTNGHDSCISQITFMTCTLSQLQIFTGMHFRLKKMHTLKI